MNVYFPDNVRTFYFFTKVHTNEETYTQRPEKYITFFCWSCGKGLSLRPRMNQNLHSVSSSKQDHIEQIAHGVTGGKVRQNPNHTKGSKNYTNIQRSVTYSFVLNNFQCFKNGVTYLYNMLFYCLSILYISDIYIFFFISN